MISATRQESRQTLAEKLSDRQPLSAEDGLELMRGLIRCVVELHAVGRLHLQISPQTISLGPDGVELQSPGTTASMEIARERMSWTPEERHRLPRALSTDVAVAQQELQAARLTTNPHAFDLLMIGNVLCQMLTAEPASAYRQSVRVKGLIPAEFRPILERILGTDGQTPFQTAQELLDVLEDIDRKRGVAIEPLSRVTEALPRTPATPTSDTTFTGMSRNPPGEDTAVESPVSDSPAPNDGALPFRRLGHFEIQARIGHGGMGDVYRAYERSLDRTVAIKVLPAEFARQADFVRRFQAEATAAARLIHPNIIQIYFIGEDSGHHLFAMQYVEGLSLAALLESQKKLLVNTTVSLIEQVLLGLE